MKTTKSVGRFLLGACIAQVLLGSLNGQAAEESRLLRFPAIHGKQIVFSHAGDLYTVSASGGVARKLTSDEGYEMFPRFSPDGKWVAFTGQYDGNTEVYLIPSAGGVPQRLTHTATLDRDDVSDRMGPNNIVMSWRDSESILFRSRRVEWNDFKGQLYLATIKGDMPAELPLPRGGWCTYSPDQKQVAYNRVFREFRTWKRYRGGQADDIWVYDFETKATVNISQNPAQDVFPMWHKRKIYFLSDRSETKRMNLYVYDLENSTTRALTDFTDYDIKFPSLGDTAIVFEKGGLIYRFDLATDECKKISITIQEDFAISRGGIKDLSKDISNYDLSPEGNRALFGAHGEIFTVPAKYGNTRNLTQTSGVHERDARWSPDGKWIAYISDASGEDEIFIMPQDGKSEPKKLTKDGDTYKYAIKWSPDSRKILWSDKKQRLSFIDVESQKTTLVRQSTEWEVRDYEWSPDNQWIVCSDLERNQMSRVYLFSLESGKTIPVTDSWFSSGNAVFSADGKYLFFVSNRNFSPRYGQTEWNHIYTDMASLYLVTLAQDVKSPFAPRSDEVKIETSDNSTPAKKEGEKTESPDTAKKDSKPAAKKVVVKVDESGLMARIAGLPVASGQYDNLISVGDKLYYQRRGSRGEGSRFMMYDLDKLKETELGDVSGYEVSADKKKMLVHADGGYAIIDLPTGRIDVKERLNVSDLKITLDRQAEWRQIYNECWRQMRDFFYAPNLHGVNWTGIRALYEPLLAHVHHRADLTYVIGEMISELNAGHAYVGGGDYPKAERIPLGLLGARLERDKASGYYRIVEILPGQNWSRSMRSPLTEIGVKAQKGDYILAVDGKSTKDINDIYRLLVNTVGKQVTLTLNHEAKIDGAREIVASPISDERPLYYLKWVQRNISKVDEATTGKVGYIHIPDMGVSGLNEFVKYYYPQLNKEALIVDVRGNGGGNVSPQIIERLRRDHSMVTIARNGAPHVDPSGMVLGPKVMLLDEFSASDGDIVAYRFKKHKLGTVIGKRSWGGVVGIRGSLPLLDGGSLNRPEFSRYDVEGKEWIMEGVGVEPDIYVDNDPAHEYAGIDDQLDKAIEVIKEAMRQQPVKIAPPPPYPNKSK